MDQLGGALPHSAVLHVLKQNFFPSNHSAKVATSDPLGIQGGQCNIDNHTASQQRGLKGIHGCDSVLKEFAFDEKMDAVGIWTHLCHLYI